MVARCAAAVLGALLVATPALAAPESAPPRLDARSWLLTDYHSGEVLAARAADERLAPASLTKLMTAYLVFREIRAGRLALKDRAVVTVKASRMPGSRMFLGIGERVPVEELLKGMLIQSGNDAAVVLAEHLAGGEESFAARMNQEARSLGMINSQFRNASGLHHPGHYASARDLSLLATVLIRDFPEYYPWYSLREFGYNGIRQPNRNTLLWREPSVDGLKTGYTRPAGHCLVSSAARHGMRLIATVLGAPSEPARNAAGRTLLDYGFGRYETRLLYQAKVPATTVRVWLGEAGELPVGLNRDLYLTLPRGAYPRLAAHALVRDLQAPVRLGQPVGTLKLLLDQKTYAEHPLIALRDVASGNMVQQAVDHLRQWLP
jgi:D-alanyl-D-alanine carboxypeptidase (penicillin-binding protein 5/6)